MSSDTLRKMVRATINRSVTGLACLALCDAPPVVAFAPIVVVSGTCGSDPARAFTLAALMFGSK